MPTVSFVDGARTVAPPGWNRWLVPPTALAIHLSIGQAYAWSVLTTPIQQALHTSSVWLVVLGYGGIAGIGVLERAAPLYQDYFRGSAPTAQVAAAATAFVSVLSLVNMAGRFVWSSSSDAVGRKNSYRVCLRVGAVLYLLLLPAGPGNKAVLLVATLLILSFYGTGFATIPAYLTDLFGTYEVGAIHGRLLTAWSVAGVLGPLIVAR